MKRAIAMVLVAAMALQASGCTTTYPAQPMVSKDVATVQTRTVAATAVNQNPNQVVAAPASVRPPDVPTSEFLGGPAAGILAGVALVGVIGLVILFGSRDDSRSRGPAPTVQ
jgi:hypothetical protein